jgi:hypothetical protein
VRLKASQSRIEQLYSLELHDENEGGPWEYFDEGTGHGLNSRDVLEARKRELEGFSKMGVYDYVDRSTAKCDSKGKLIGVRWVDVLKADVVKSRLVAQEFAGKNDRDDIFAATPPLSATKLLLSDACSNGDGRTSSIRVMIMDIKQAFLYGEIKERIYIELPEEDVMKKKGKVGILRKAMYGTRCAPQVWQNLVRERMTELGFEESAEVPCLYVHQAMNVKVVTHVDDFLCSGSAENLLWLRSQLEEHFELKGEILGNSHGEVREGSFLGRKIQVHPWGMTYECDEKHTTILLSEWGMEDCAEVKSPGTSVDQEENDDLELAQHDASVFRRAAARVNYMAQDRGDLSYASKELSRGMKAPKNIDVKNLKRVLRYLKDGLGHFRPFLGKNVPPKFLGTVTRTGRAALEHVARQVVELFSTAGMLCINGHLRKLWWR